MTFGRQPRNSRATNPPYLRSACRDSIFEVKDYRGKLQCADISVADDGDFGGGDFEAHQAMTCIEVEIDFEV